MWEVTLKSTQFHRKFVAATAKQKSSMEKKITGMYNKIKTKKLAKLLRVFTLHLSPSINFTITSTHLSLSLLHLFHTPSLHE